MSDKYQNTNKASVRQIQSSLFMSGLSKAMGKLSSEYKKDSMVKAAHQYVSDGMTIGETKELLKLDGYDPMLIDAYANNIDQNEFVEDNTPDWAFDAEDSYGRIYASSDFNIIVKANNKDEAWQQAEANLEGLSSTGINRIIDVYQV
jgi:hypothetical protein